MNYVVRFSNLRSGQHDHRAQEEEQQTREICYFSLFVDNSSLNPKYMHSVYKFFLQAAFLAQSQHIDSVSPLREGFGVSAHTIIHIVERVRDHTNPHSEALEGIAEMIATVCAECLRGIPFNKSSFL